MNITKDHVKGALKLSKLVMAKMQNHKTQTVETNKMAILNPRLSISNTVLVAVDSGILKKKIFKLF